MENVEQAIAERASNAPRVTLAQIESEIASEHCFTAADGYEGAQLKHQKAAVDAPAPLALLTFCVLALRNGFTVVGQSACASPENFDSEIGQHYARQDAIRQCWSLFGFRLRDQLAMRECLKGLPLGDDQSPTGRDRQG